MDFFWNAGRKTTKCSRLDLYDPWQHEIRIFIFGIYACIFHEKLHEKSNRNTLWNNNRICVSSIWGIHFFLFIHDYIPLNPSIFWRCIYRYRTWWTFRNCTWRIFKDKNISCGTWLKKEASASFVFKFDYIIFCFKILNIKFLNRKETKMFDKLEKEFQLLVYHLYENQVLQMEFLSSLIVVVAVLYVVYFGLKKKKIRECFAVHEYEIEPVHFNERMKLYLSAPLLSGNGIAMWRVYFSIPLAMLTVLFYKETVVSSILLQFYVFLFVTDALDGAVARSLNNVTNLGKVLDPFADKFLDLIILAIVCLFSNNSFFVLSAVFICMVDIAGQSVRAKTSNPAANWVGKTKTVFKVITIYVVSLNRFDLYLDYIGGTLLIISAAFTFASFYLKIKDRLKFKSWEPSQMKKSHACVAFCFL